MKAFKFQKRGVNMERTDFSRYAKKYWDTVYRVAYNYYGNCHDAEDAVQEVMLKLYKCGKDFDSEEHIRNWLIKVTINNCKSILRSFWKKSHVSTEELPETPVWDNSEESELFTAVMSLPQNHRTVIYLYYYEEYSTKQIAEILGNSEAHIRTKISRARDKLKEALTNETTN